MWQQWEKKQHGKKNNSSCDNNEDKTNDNTGNKNISCDNIGDKKNGNTVKITTVAVI